jgi:hypothetical protein
VQRGSDAERSTSAQTLTRIAAEINVAADELDDGDFPASSCARKGGWGYVCTTKGSMVAHRGRDQGDGDLMHDAMQHAERRARRGLDIATEKKRLTEGGGDAGEAGATRRSVGGQGNAWMLGTHAGRCPDDDTNSDTRPAELQTFPATVTSTASLGAKWEFIRLVRRCRSPRGKYLWRRGGCSRRRRVTGDELTLGRFLRRGRTGTGVRALCLDMGEDERE